MTSARRRWAPLAAPLVVAIAPLVVAVVRALRRGWIPMGDNAYFTIRARDVLTEHHPLVGAWSSGSETVGVDVNNLGPLQLDLLAMPVRALGAGPGTAVGVALVNLAAIVAVVVLCHRRLGRLGGWVGALLAASVQWTLGSELLFEPRQHHALVLPFLAFLVSVWAAVAGERWALPVAAALGSLVAQTHLTFVPPVLLVGGAALAAVVLLWRRHAGWRRPAITTLVVLGIAWVQTLVEQLQPSGGNVSALVRAARADDADRSSFGLGHAARALAEVSMPPSGWWRPAFRTFDPATSLPSAASAAGLLLVLAALHLLVGWLALRREDQPVVAWIATSAVALAAGLVGAAVSPVSGPFGPVSGNFRFLWPIAAFSTAGLLVGALRALPHRLSAASRAAVASLAAVVALAALPTSYQSPGPEADAPLIPVATDLARQVRHADLAGPVAVDRSGMFFGEPYSYVVVGALQEAGVPFVFDAPTDVARFGERRARREPVEGTVSFVTGDRALEPVTGARLLARSTLLDQDERAELARLDAAAADGSLGSVDAARRRELQDLAARGTVAVWLTPEPGDRSG